MPRCFDCGLLAVRDEYRVDLVVEATRSAREMGRQQCSNGSSPMCKFLCYGNSPVFPKIPKDGSSAEKSEALKCEVDCGTFRRYHPGKSPQEHEEMSIVERVQLAAAEAQATARAEAAAAKAEAKAEAERAAAEAKSHAEKHRKEDREFAIAAERRSFRVAFASLIVSIIAVIAGVASAIYAAYISRQ